VTPFTRYRPDEVARSVRVEFPSGLETWAVPGRTSPRQPAGRLVSTPRGRRRCGGEPRASPWPPSGSGSVCPNSGPDSCSGRCRTTSAARAAGRSSGRNGITRGAGRPTGSRRVAPTGLRRALCPNGGSACGRSSATRARAGGCAAAGAGSSGLGLSIVRWVAQAHGGVLRVYNAEEGGAIFELSLPEA